MEFAAFLFTKGLSGGTVKSYLAALCYTQISFSLGDLQICNMSQLEYVIKGCKKSLIQPAPDILAVLKHFWEL